MSDAKIKKTTIFLGGCLAFFGILLSLLSPMQSGEGVNMESSSIVKLPQSNGKVKKAEKKPAEIKFFTKELWERMFSEENGEVLLKDGMSLTFTYLWCLYNNRIKSEESPFLSLFTKVILFMSFGMLLGGLIDCLIDQQIRVKVARELYHLFGFIGVSWLSLMFFGFYVRPVILGLLGSRIIYYFLFDYFFTRCKYPGFSDLPNKFYAIWVQLAAIFLLIIKLSKDLPPKKTKESSLTLLIARILLASVTMLVGYFDVNKELKKKFFFFDYFDDIGFLVGLLTVAMTMFNLTKDTISPNVLSLSIVFYFLMRVPWWMTWRKPAYSPISNSWRSGYLDINFHRLGFFSVAVMVVHQIFFITYCQ